MQKQRLIIKIMQVVGIISFLVLVALVSILFFANYFEATPGSQGVMTECTLNGQTNYYTVVYDEYRNIEAVKSDGNYLTDININIEEFESPESLLLYIEEYIISQGGTCK